MADIKDADGVIEYLKKYIKENVERSKDIAEKMVENGRIPRNENNALFDAADDIIRDLQDEGRVERLAKSSSLTQRSAEGAWFSKLDERAHPRN